jgi:hypothetical protein
MRVQSLPGQPVLSAVSFNVCEAVENEYKHGVLFPLLTEYDCPIIHAGSKKKESAQDFIFQESDRFYDRIRYLKPEWAEYLITEYVKHRGRMYRAQRGELKCQVLRRKDWDTRTLVWTGNGFTEISRRLDKAPPGAPAKPSGLSVSRAQFWFEAFHDVIYIVPIAIMHQFISRRDVDFTKDTRRFHETAGDGNAAGVSWERSMFVEACSPLVYNLSHEQRELVLRCVEAKEEEARRSKARLV